MVLLKRDSYDISAITEHEALVEKGFSLRLKWSWEVFRLKVRDFLS